MSVKKNDNQVVVTREGYERLSAELVDLRTVRRLEVARQLEEARAFGDLSENAEYAAAKDEQSKVESRILELETMLAKTRIVDEEKLDTNKVAIGLTVTLQELSPPKKRYTYMLVGSEESLRTICQTLDYQELQNRIQAIYIQHLYSKFHRTYFP